MHGDRALPHLRLVVAGHALAFLVAALRPGLASGLTGETHHVDAGYNVIGMKAEDAPDIGLEK